MAHHHITQTHSVPSAPPPRGSPPVHFPGPVYVNARQYARILKRREAKLIIDAKLKLNPPRKRYLHESRHNHACKRPRGTGGRFLTKAELDAINSQGQQHIIEGSNEFLSDHAKVRISTSENTESTNQGEIALRSLNSCEGEQTDQEESKYEGEFDDVVSL
jgi:hypothetical protein